ncbi:MAG: hypothetical protein JNM31_00375 [Flavobacteriales bacterium]|nr:hypothetical protein [Flavobacteriales bacterium]
MARSLQALDSRLFLHSLQSPDAEPGMLKYRVAELEHTLATAQEEIELLTCERDELVAAIKKWAKADRLERQDLLLESTTQDLRTELKVLRNENKRLKRENSALLGQQNDERNNRRMRA